MSRFKVGDRANHCGTYVDVAEVDGQIIGIRFGDGTITYTNEARLSLVVQKDDALPDPDEASGTLTASDPGVVTLGTPNKYARTIYPLQGEPAQIDVYRVLDAFAVTDPAIQHAVKKLLMPGERGAKSTIQDLEEAAFSVKQAVELMKQKGGG